MTRTITRSYDSYETAAAVVENLEAAGIAAADISVVGRDERAKDSNAAEGAGIGAGVGGAAGLLAGLGMLAIPGIGPVVAAGWLASTAAGAVAGAAAGGLVGSFTNAGVDEDEAHYHAETVRRGGTVVSVKASDAHAATAEAIMDGATPIDRDTRIGQYRNEGWTRFDETAAPYKSPIV
ncbi:general stress protein [Bosea sp. 124]|uniref:general stress protein n=1 Tax=Bosea sp. 124 TaxID=2135642 RepID=UPI000D3AB6E4|nr:general stress protein [Bosea sp. 124]PTM40300.1 putative membrane protein [Bosea sp. 124]